MNKLMNRDELIEKSSKIVEEVTPLVRETYGAYACFSIEKLFEKKFELTKEEQRLVRRVAVWLDYSRYNVPVATGVLKGLDTAEKFMTFLGKHKEEMADGFNEQLAQELEEIK